MFDAGVNFLPGSYDILVVYAKGVRNVSATVPVIVPPVPSIIFLV